MAGNRLLKTGSIFQRLSGIIKTDAMKEQDIPLWYDIYKAFPPKYEPTFARPPVQKEIPPIFYPEDIIRAKFEKLYGSKHAHNMLDSSEQFVMQRYVEIYLKFQKNGKNLSDDDLIKATESALEEQGITFIRSKKVKGPIKEKENLTKELVIE